MYPPTPRRAVRTQARLIACDPLEPRCLFDATHAAAYQPPPSDPYFPTDPYFPADPQAPSDPPPVSTDPQVPTDPYFPTDPQAPTTPPSVPTNPQVPTDPQFPTTPQRVPTAPPVSTNPYFPTDPYFPTTPITPVPSSPVITGSLTSARPSATPNAPASVTLSLTNPSQAKPIARKYTVTYYLSADRTYSADDTKFSKQTITANLARKQTKSYTLSYKLPKAAPLGTRYVIAVADTPDRSTAAHLEVASSKPLKILGPHLTAAVRSVTPTSRPDTVKVTVRVLNDGPAPFTGPATLRLLSDTPDAVLLTTRKSVTLKAGKYAEYIFNVRRPAGAALSVTVA